MKIEELDETSSLANESGRGATATTKMWSIGKLYTRMHNSRKRRAINTPKTTTSSDDEFSSAEDEAVSHVSQKQTTNSEQLSKEETDRLRYMGILDEYLASKKAAAGNGSEDVSGTEVGTIWTKFEKQKWKFKVVFFIVYTVFAVINFILVYNFYNYYALILQILNIAVTYSLLVLSL